MPLLAPAAQQNPMELTTLSICRQRRGHGSRNCILLWPDQRSDGFRDLALPDAPFIIG
jgi:hypothetical protein